MSENMKKFADELRDVKYSASAASGEAYAKKSSSESEVSGDTAEADKDEADKLVIEVYDEMGVIGPETKVDGNIVTKGHVTVLGTVKGDISASGNVIVRGPVTGKIVCNNLLLESSNVEASIEAKGQVQIKSEVTVKGEILCGSVNVMGTVLGDITASDKVGLSETAVIRGNISAAYLGAAFGAKINGKSSIG